MSRKPLTYPSIVLLVVSCALPSGSPSAETDTVLILHTNDIHDHVRVDYDGSGGMPYVSGYIRAQKAQRNDVLVLDAGDVMEKGDRVAFESQSRLTYRAMARAGYDAVAPGNHDDAYGLQHLVDCESLIPQTALLCVNLFDESGDPLFASSKTFDVDGVRVGVIGMDRPRGTQSLTLEESAAAIASEANRLDEECQLVVLTCHASVQDCVYISSVAPAVDVFVSGHTHAILREPKRTDCGAIVVQAGSYGEYVGRLAITLDLGTEEFTGVEGELIPMDKDHAQLDETVVKWVTEEEQKLAPNANNPVTHTKDGLNMLSIARIGAAALREYGKADIAFCHSGQIIRDELPAGDVDENAIFRTGQRAHELVIAELSGADINAYITGLARTNWGQTTWSGFRASRKGKAYKTSLDPKKVYRVIMPRLEWDTRFIRYFERYDKPSVARFTCEPAAFNYTDAVSEYIRSRRLADDSLSEHCVELAAAMSLD